MINNTNTHHSIYHKGPWSNDEDSIILKYTSKNIYDWNLIASQVSGRTAKQCREHYQNKLDPNLLHKPW